MAAGPERGTTAGGRGYREAMDAVVLLLAIVGLFAVSMGGMVWLAHQVRTRGVGGSVLGPIQDMWDPAVRHTQVQIEIQAERRAPTPAPGDPPAPDHSR